jgi:hypothetical protein
MSLRVKLVIAIVAVGIATLTVAGDGWLTRALALPQGSSRIVVAALLLVVGVIWFVWSGRSVRKTLRDVRNRSGKE